MTGVTSAVFYVTNWFAALGWRLPPIGHLWSLAVEEQFYLLWPPAVVVALRWRGTLGVRQVTTALAAASGAWGIGLWFAGVSPARLHFGTDVRIVAILVGACVALWHVDGRLDAIARPRVRSILAVAGCVALTWIALNVTEGDPNVRAFFAPIALAAVAVMMFVVEHPESLGARLLSTDSLVWLGRRSYAIYLWHYPLATWTRGLGWAGAVTGIVASLLLAELSWHLVEVRAKERLLRN